MVTSHLVQLRESCETHMNKPNDLDLQHNARKFVSCWLQNCGKS